MRHSMEKLQGGRKKNRNKGPSGGVESGEIKEKGMFCSDFASLMGTDRGKKSLSELHKMYRKLI